MDTMIGAQASSEQMEKICSYLDVGKDEGADVLAGGNKNQIDGLANGYYVEPTAFKGEITKCVFSKKKYLDQ